MKYSFFASQAFVASLIWAGEQSALGAGVIGRAGASVECEAVSWRSAEFLYYVFDWGDGNISATARGAAHRKVYEQHRFDKPGKYNVTWSAVTMSGQRYPGKKIVVDITGPAVAPPANITATATLTYPAAKPMPSTPLRTTPQDDAFGTAWIGKKYDRLYRFDEVVLTPAAEKPFPEYFAVEYSADTGQTWQEIPSACYVHFPNPRGKRVRVPLHGVTANALRVVANRLPCATQGYGLELGAFDAIGSERLLFQCDGGAQYNAAFNNLWLIFGSAENEIYAASPWFPTDSPDCGGMMGTGSTIWAYWNALKLGWINTRYQAYYEDRLNSYPLDEEGRIGVSAGQWRHLGHSRHYSALPIFISGVVYHFLSHRDPALLERKDKTTGLTLLEKVRKVMHYQLHQMQGESGVLTITDPENDGTSTGLSDNYWDAWRFGYKSAYENALFYDSLLKMAMLEEYLGETRAANDYRALAGKVREQFNRLFWDEAKGRYIATIDRLGNRHDYGFTFVNLEAMAYGVVPEERGRRILAWLDGQRIIAGETSTGADIYHFRIAPRANTVAAESVQPTWWDNWAMEVGKDRMGAYGIQLQNGGTIFYVSYFDLLARLKAAGIANAMQRMDVIVNEFGKDQLRRQLGNRFGSTHVVGILREFPESGLVPLFYLHGILGIQPVADGLVIAPHLPDGWSFAEVTEYHYAGEVYQIRVERNATQARISKGNGRITLVVPAQRPQKLQLLKSGEKQLVSYLP
ncbi:MAG: hypothetical protein EPN23_07770 [Verrucomicrobia bacterium]|nr:MAG: hypothetical protein EPN23_07770 [Verrucomicrobiota bacterium]